VLAQPNGCLVRQILLAAPEQVIIKLFLGHLLFLFFFVALLFIFD
jgi:hypothetical protein